MKIAGSRPAARLGKRDRDPPARAGKHTGVMPQALIVIDMLNRYEHKDAEPLMRSVAEVLPAIEELIREARGRGLLTVWVNDNHGDWTAGRNELVSWARGGRDRSLIDPIAPPDDQPFVVKARHSIFYGTQLEYLLRSSGVDRIVLAGQVTEQCILYSALDSYVRHLDVSIPRDAVAHIVPELAEAALHMMERNMRAHVVEAADVFDSPGAS